MFSTQRVQQTSYTPSFKVIVLGNGSVGKTSLINRFCNEIFSTPYQPSIGYPVQAKKVKIDNQKANLKLWEINPDKSSQYGRAHQSAMANAAAYVVLFDITNKASFESAIEHIKMLQATVNAGQKPGNIFLVSTKSDLEKYRAITNDEIMRVATEYDCTYMATSSKLNDNVNELFHSVARTVLARKPQDENDWVMMSSEASVPTALLNILSDSSWAKSESMFSNLKKSLNEMVALLKSGNFKTDEEYLQEMQRIAQPHCIEQSNHSTGFFKSTAAKSSNLKSAFQAILKASSLTTAATTLMEIRDQALSHPSSGLVK